MPLLMRKYFRRCCPDEDSALTYRSGVFFVGNLGCIKDATPL